MLHPKSTPIGGSQKPAKCSSPLGRWNPIPLWLLLQTYPSLWLNIPGDGMPPVCWMLQIIYICIHNNMFINIYILIYSLHTAYLKLKTCGKSHARKYSIWSLCSMSQTRFKTDLNPFGDHFPNPNQHQTGHWSSPSSEVSRVIVAQGLSHRETPNHVGQALRRELRWLG